MDQASHEMRYRRAAAMQSRRAADELLIDAIFGDAMVARSARHEEGLPSPQRAAAACDPSAAPGSAPLCEGL